MDLFGESAEAIKAATDSAISLKLFAEVWPLYPNKIEKKDAVAAWQKLQPGRDLVDTIISAIGAQKLGRQWKRDGGRYIPSFARWLRKERWEDVVEPAGPDGAAGREIEKAAAAWGMKPNEFSTTTNDVDEPDWVREQP